MNNMYRIVLAAPLLLCGVPVLAQSEPAHDLRDITVGMQVAAIPDAGYVNLVCADEHERKLAQWSAWRDCPAGADALRAVNFGFDPETSHDGTLVAGHPVLLTLRVDDSGRVAGLQIDTDPKARLYLHKKAFLLGTQVKSRYGDDGWSCAQQPPGSGEEALGGVYLKESCRKLDHERAIVVERELFRRLDQGPNDFVDRTRVSITQVAN